MSDQQSDSSRAAWVHDIVQEYEGRLLRYASHVLGDVDRARDVVQDTFVKLCREPRQKIEGHVGEWLFTVCRNRAFDVQRKEKRMNSMTEQQSRSQASREKGQAEAAEQRDSADQVMRVLGQLSANQQEVVRLKFQSQLSYKEISRITDLSVSNVGYLIHTAVQKLRQELSVDCS